MRTTTLVFVVVFLLGSAAIAQDQPTIARAFILHVSPANTLEFEDAYKQHIAWHGQNNDPWRWDTWERISGNELGVYVVRTPGHYWKDFDSSPLGAADREHFLKNVAAQVDSVDSTIANLLVNVSQLPEGDADLNLVSVVSFLLRPGGIEDFLHGIGKAHEAIVEAKRPVHYGWLMVMNGGEGPRMILALFHENWAAVPGPEKPFWTMMEEIYGRQEATALQEMFNEVIVSQESSMFRYRKDLSHIPQEE